MNFQFLVEAMLAAQTTAGHSDAENILQTVANTFGFPDVKTFLQVRIWFCFLSLLSELSYSVLQNVWPSAQYSELVSSDVGLTYYGQFKRRNLGDTFYQLIWHFLLVFVKLFPFQR